MVGMKSAFLDECKPSAASAQSIAIALLSSRLPPDAHVQLTQEESAVEALFVNMPSEASEFLWTIHDTPHTYGGDHMVDCERISRTDYLLAGAIHYAEVDAKNLQKHNSNKFR